MPGRTNWKKTTAVLATAVLMAGAGCGDDDEVADEATAATEAESMETQAEPDETEPAPEPEAEPTKPTEPETDVTEAPEPDGTEEAQAVDLEPGRLVVGLVDCEQTAVVAPIRRTEADELVPEPYESAAGALANWGVDAATGDVPLLHVSKTCQDMTVDGTSMGPGQLDVQWVQVTGPQQQRSYPEYPDHFVLPTDYMYPVTFTTDSEGAFEAIDAFGAPIVLADSMEMDPISAGRQTGSATSRDGEYSWTIQNVTEASAPLFFVHMLERREGDYVYQYTIECPATQRFAEGPGRLEPGPGSPFEAVGSSVEGLGWALDIDCTVTVQRSLPEE